MSCNQLRLQFHKEIYEKGILALALVLCIPGLAHANEPEEVVVYGVDLSSAAKGAIQVALSSVILIHEYNEEEEAWDLASTRCFQGRKRILNLVGLRPHNLRNIL